MNGGLIKRWYGPLFTVRPWRESAHLLLDLGIGIAFFTIAVTMLSLSAGLMITLVGLPLLVVTVWVGRWFGIVERGRARALLGSRLPAPARLDRSGGWWPRTKEVLADRAGWKGLLYGVLMLPWGIVTFTVTVVVWSVSLSLVAFSALWWVVPSSADGGPFRFGSYELLGWGRVGYIVGAGVVGLLLLALTPKVIHALASADHALIRNLLSRSDAEALEQQVSALTVSRDASIESADSQLRRIERDLHDGAQQRLVSLAMDLGIAKDRLADVGDARSAELVAHAHVHAKQAIVELRDLVRGIHPAVLTDRGLDAAVSSLASRCPVAVTVSSELDQHRRFPSPVEATAYFVIAEALTNVAKHSHATSASVHLREGTGTLVLEVRDDGVGGAADDHGGGLRGLRDRVAGAEGELHISSPAGGPTVLAVELPCES